MSKNIPQFSKNNVNWEAVISIEWIDFIDTKMTSSSIGEALAFLKWERKYEEFILDNQRKIHQFFWNTFIVEYKNKEIRDTDRNLLKKHFKPTRHLSQQEDDGSQVPETDFKVDYEWKYYLSVNAHLKLSNDTNLNKWVYKWVIFNPWISFPLDTTIWNIVWKVDDIV